MSQAISDLYPMLYRQSPPLIKTKQLDEIPAAMNGVIFVVIAAINLYQFLGAPLLIARNPWYALTLIPTLLISSTTGVLVHEAIHGMLHRHPAANRLMGQVMAVFVGISYDLQRIDHLKHHKWSRTVNDCDEVYLAPAKSRRKIARYYYSKLVGAFYHDFFLTCVIAWLPRALMLRVMSVLYATRVDGTDGSPLSTLIRTNKLTALRWEGMASILLLAAGTLLYWPFLWILVCLLILRALILTVLDSFAHYGTPLNDSSFAKNVRMPYFFERYCMLNFNYHGVHHVFPTTPWIHLPAHMQHFAPNFYFIQHGGLRAALKAKYTPPRCISAFPSAVGSAPTST
ncbi:MULTISPECIES: fatty acid desaturase [unclassified Undibacterium]|uniref:fatty acid desaturase family protein n=2 Tax=Bacteria TaxID=2 RepID=UPI002AC89A3C|nr:MULTISPECIES: fatty acid desaturase [unclassified Undibacterium]MEB0140490.1 fatty acid desaturase [Undibacterium sp. CCC2.1]MEB0174159.1 fatty acid desaturase [Undibacterium sp. CCC1.1]MEB0178094.1 fatty acid desaturase [Undibacterium sp. CCC3.4]MEB0217309.1 fatty acid desaturase [Undibacterium sp. 5I2]WPX44620.1 fatty acid desaturase [Undibacterium sp. CCC3.4]